MKVYGRNPNLKSNTCDMDSTLAFIGNFFRVVRA